MASKKTSKKGSAKKPAGKKMGSLKSVDPLITEKTLKSLLNRCDERQTRANSISGSIREDIGDHQEKHHLHTKAFSTLRQIKKMCDKNPAAAHDYLAHVLAYCDMTGLTAKMESAPRLPLEEDEEEEAAEKKSNVVRPRQFGQAGAKDDPQTLTGAQPDEPVQNEQENVALA